MKKEIDMSVKLTLREYQELLTIKMEKLKLDMKYTEKQIKEAFWRNFHKSGEMWFEDLGTDIECEQSTDIRWENFKKYLPKHKLEILNFLRW